VPRIDGIKEELAFLRDGMRNLFIVFMGLITGSFTVVYQVLTGRVDTLFTYLALIGIIFALLTLILINRKRNTADKLIKELERID